MYNKYPASYTLQTDQYFMIYLNKIPSERKYSGKKDKILSNLFPYCTSIYIFEVVES